MIRKSWSHDGWFGIQISSSTPDPALYRRPCLCWDWDWHWEPLHAMVWDPLQMSNCHLCSENSSSSFLSNCRKVLVISHKMLLSFVCLDGFCWRGWTQCLDLTWPSAASPKRVYFSLLCPRWVPDVNSFLWSCQHRTKTPHHPDEAPRYCRC